MNKKIICIFIVLILILTIKPISLAANEVRMETIDSDIAWIGDMEIVIDDDKNLIVWDDNLHDASAKWVQSGLEIIGHVGINITFIKGHPRGLIELSIMVGNLWLNYFRKALPYAIGPGIIPAVLVKDDHQIIRSVKQFSVPISILSDDEIRDEEFELRAAVKPFVTLGIRIFQPKWGGQTKAVNINISYD